jgi:neutral ceramidase
VQDCHGRGPGFRISDFESNRLIGLAQMQGAQEIMEGSRSSVSGGVKSVHIYMNMYGFLHSPKLDPTASSPVFIQG